MRGAIFCVVLLAGVASGAVRAAASFDEDYDAKSWTEIQVALPPYPQAEDLLSFRVGAVRDTQFMIDRKSIAIGSDGVVRYSLVVVGSGGARNVSYEGIRCVTGERRFYAFGRTDGTWGKARSNQWVTIRGGTNNHHVELYTNYLCSMTTPLSDVDEILRRVRSKAQIDYGK